MSWEARNAEAFPSHFKLSMSRCSFLQKGRGKAAKKRGTKFGTKSFGAAFIGWKHRDQVRVTRAQLMDADLRALRYGPRVAKEVR